MLVLVLPLSFACRGSSAEPANPRAADASSPTPNRPASRTKSEANGQSNSAAQAGELTEAEAYARRAKAAEALGGAARLNDAAAAIHDEESICHLWPEGKIGPVPPLGVRCEEGPDHACVVIDPPGKPSESWEYSASAWDTPEWRALGYRRFDSHYYRYAVEWHFEGEGDDRHCVVLTTATGDLDGDGVAGTYERRFPPFSTDSEGNLVFRRIVNELE